MINKSQRILPEVMTGVFVLAVIALLGFFTIIISGVDWLRGTNTVLRRVAFENVGQLKVQDPVTVRGMKVGSVQELNMGDGCVWVTFRIKANVPLYSDCTVSVAQTSLLGGSCLEIVQGTPGEALSPEIPLSGKTPKNVMDDLSEVVADLRQSLNPEDLREALGNIRKASADIASITGRIEGGDGLVGKLLSPEDTTYADLQATLANVRGITDDIRSGKGLVGKLLSEDDTTYDNLSQTIANVRDVSEGLRDGRGLIGKLLREEDSTYADLQASMANIRSITAKTNDPQTAIGRLLSNESTLVGDLEATAANLKAVTAKLDAGEGTLGKLVNDDGLATEVEATVRDVRQIIDNMRDTAPITTFTSLFFGGL